MTTKTTKKTVNASTNTPATPKTPLRHFENATVIYFDTKKEQGKTYIHFRATDGVVRSALANPAIRWKDRLNTPMLLKIDDTCKPWKLAMKPTEEEKNAYALAQAPQVLAYATVERTADDDEALEF